MRLQTILLDQKIAQKSQLYYFFLKSGTAEQASPYIIDLATGFSLLVNKISAFRGTGLFEQPFIMMGKSV